MPWCSSAPALWPPFPYLPPWLPPSRVRDGAKGSASRYPSPSAFLTAAAQTFSMALNSPASGSSASPNLQSSRHFPHLQDFSAALAAL